jgi:hypothetical protein
MLATIHINGAMLLPQLLVNSLSPRNRGEQQQGYCGCNQESSPRPQPACDAQCSADPHARCCREPFYSLSFSVSQNDPCSDEADAGHDALEDALHDAAHGVCILGHSLDLYGRHARGRGTERDKPKRSHADRLLREIAVQSDCSSCGHSRKQAHDDVLEV